MEDGPKIIIAAIIGFLIFVALLVAGDTYQKSHTPIDCRCKAVAP